MSEFKNDQNAIKAFVSMLSYIEMEPLQQIIYLTNVLEASLKSKKIFEKEAQKNYAEFDKQINIVRYILHLTTVLKCHEFSVNDCEPNQRWQLKQECLEKSYELNKSSTDTTDLSDPLALDKLFFILCTINHLLHISIELFDRFIHDTQTNLERSTADDKFGCLCMMSLRYIKHNRAV